MNELRDKMVRDLGQVGLKTYLKELHNACVDLQMRTIGHRAKEWGSMANKLNKMADMVKDDL